MYQRILVPVDGSPTSDAGLTEAIQLAKLTGAQLRLVHMVQELPFVLSAEGYGALSADVRTLVREGGAAILAAARARVLDSGVAVDTVLFDDFSRRLCEHIADQATQWKADLIVLGTHGRRGASRLFLGSDAEQVLRLAPVPVLLVRSPESVDTPTKTA